MPTTSVAVSAVEARVADYDPARTILIFSNPSATDLVYVSDAPGVYTNGIIVPLQSSISMSLIDGWNTRAAHYAYCAAAVSLKVGTGSQWVSPVIVGTPGGDGDGLPHGMDPPM